MPSAQVYPYGFVLRDSGGVDFFPAADVSFKNNRGEWTTFYLVVDSGARVTALPISDAKFLGLVPEEGEVTKVRGIEHRPRRGWTHHLTARIAGEIIQLPVVFVSGAQVPRVLGRSGFFDSFTVVLEEKYRRTSFLETRSREAARVKDTIDGIAAEMILG